VERRCAAARALVSVAISAQVLSTAAVKISRIELVSPDLIEKVGWLAVGLIFQAGILYGVIQSMKRDQNGMGRKIRDIQHANEQRYLTTVIVSLARHVPKENQDAYQTDAKMFLEAASSRNL
jgi:hypothetical protein